MSKQSFVKVEASPTFKRNIKILGKKYRSIHKDVEAVIKLLLNGEFFYSYTVTIIFLFRLITNIKCA